MESSVIFLALVNTIEHPSTMCIDLSRLAAALKPENTFGTLQQSIIAAFS